MRHVKPLGPVRPCIKGVGGTGCGRVIRGYPRASTNHTSANWRIVGYGSNQPGVGGNLKMSNLCEIHCMANAVKFYDGKDHLAAITNGTVKAYGAAVNGSVTVLDGEPVHGFAMAFVDAAVWNTVAAGKPTIGMEIIVLAMCEDNGVKPGIKQPYHDFKVVEVLDVSLVDKLTPAAREMIAARGVATSVIPYVSEISSGNRKVAKM